MMSMEAVVKVVVAMGLIAASAGCAINASKLEAVAVTKPVFGPEIPDLTLDFPFDEQEVRKAAGGTSTFTVRGRIRNVSEAAASVPAILLVLRDRHERIVFSTQLTDAGDMLQPGEAKRVEQVVDGFPKTARFVEIGWKPE